MQFTLEHSRDLVGQRIHVTVLAASGQVIVNVKTTLDAFPLGDDTMNPPSVRYERTFRQVGTGGPGLKHTLIVTAHDQDGKEESATSIWEDDA